MNNIAVDTISVIRTNSDNEDFAALIQLLDKCLHERYGEQQKFFNQFNKLDAIKNVVIAYVNGVPAGCGAFKKYSDHSIEIKRMFVKDEYRRRGIAEKVLKELESWAAESNFTAAVLETGRNQPESMDLYQKVGYVITENYGQYAGVEISVCMKKGIA